MKSILTLTALAVIAVLILNSCRSRSGGIISNTVVKDLWLNSHRPSPRPDIYSAQFVKEPVGDSWKELTIPIDGFTYTAGQIYHLRVEELESEGEMKNYRLVEIVSAETDPLQLITDIYVLRGIPGELKADELRDVRCTIELHAGNRTIMGTAPCNQFSGMITELSSNRISFSPLRATKMACPNLGIEKMVFARLDRVRNYERKGLQLLFTDDDGELLLILGKID